MGVVQAGQDRQVAEEADVLARGLCLDPDNTRPAFRVVQVLYGTDEARRNGDLYAPCFASYSIDSIDGIRGDKSRRLRWVFDTEVLCGFVLIVRCLVPQTVLVLLKRL